MLTNYKYNDIILYCKGWYHRDGNLLNELGYLFSQIYGWEPKKSYEIAPMMIRILDDLNSKEVTHVTLYIFNYEVHKYMSIYDIDYDMAVIYYIRGIMQGLSRDDIKLTAPHYGKKEYFRMGCLIGENPISMTYTEMNRRAKATFG